MALLPTFAKWVDAFGIPESADLSAEDRVTVAWLQYDQSVAARIDEMRADPVAGGNLRGVLDVLSEDIIDSHLGDGWFTEHVDDSSSSALTRNYLNFEGPPESRLLAAHRAHDLARRLYQLQSFPWFDSLVRRVQTRDFSGAGFELDVVFMLHNLIARVSPKDETGQKGDDYDIRLQVYGLDVPVEVKAKDDDTVFTDRTAIRTVKNAASQLPKGSKGIIFIRIPSAWTDEFEQYKEALADAVRQTSRVGAVITVIDTAVLNETSTAGHVERSYDFLQAADCPEILWRACLHLKEAFHRNWMFLAPSPPF